MANVTTIKPPENQSTFRGYYLREDAEWESLGCAENEAFYTQKGYGLCCPTTERDCVTAMVTSCSGNFPVATTTYTCGDGTACRTMLIYDQFPVTAAGAAVTNIVCAEPAWSVGVLYRNVPSPLIPTITASPSTPAASTSAAGQPSPADEPKSNAWIAGAVVGSVIAAALIAAMGFWVFRLKRRIASMDQTAHSFYPPPPAQIHEVEAPYDHKVAELPVKNNDAELPATSPHYR